jgi:hypothetical protein
MYTLSFACIRSIRLYVLSKVSPGKQAKLVNLTLKEWGGLTLFVQSTNLG